MEESEESKSVNHFVPNNESGRRGRRRSYFTVEQQKEGKRVKQKRFRDKRRDEYH
jgi:hypothetical protein